MANQKNEPTRSVNQYISARSVQTAVKKFWDVYTDGKGKFSMSEILRKVEIHGLSVSEVVLVHAELRKRIETSAL